MEEIFRRRKNPKESIPSVLERVGSDIRPPNPGPHLGNPCHCVENVSRRKCSQEQDQSAKRMIPFIFPTLGDLPGLLGFSILDSVLQDSQRNHAVKQKKQTDMENTNSSPESVTWLEVSTNKFNETLTGDNNIGYSLASETDSYTTEEKVPIRTVASQSSDEVAEVETFFASDHEVMPAELNRFLSSHMIHAELDGDPTASTIEVLVLLLSFLSYNNV